MELPDRQRLEKLLGMLGSSFDGERANAARMIAAMAERHRLTIAELVLGTAAPSRPYARPRPETERRSRPSPSRPSHKASRTILDALAEIAMTPDEWEFTLTEWECQFADDVSKRYENDYELSEKQIQVSERIIRKVEVMRERNGGGSA